jgi:phenylalanyl-tRNA synthetase beta chain
VRVPLSWLRDHVAEVPADPVIVGEAFVKVGLELEEIHPLPEITGPLTVGRVLEIEELTEFKKPIRFCRVDVGNAEPQGIVCGARNFAVGDLIVAALPGSVLPGPFPIAARETYGKVSDGMICSARELGVGSDHAGILVLPPGTAEPGDDALPVLGLDDPVVELAITPDRGYCFAVRGIARELAASLATGYTDPALQVTVPAETSSAYPVRIDDEGCARFVTRTVVGVDASAPTPWWMQRRLLAAGMRPISLTVDVTNFVMLDLGQPIHAYDASRLQGDIVVRRAKAGEKLTTLDDVVRTLDPDDLLITDDSGPIGLAGVMGGASTEIPLDKTGTVDVVVEAAHFVPTVIARAARRHKLPSEASKRFERAVDPELPPIAAELVANLLVEHGGGRIEPGRTDVGAAPALPSITMALDLPDRYAGTTYAPGATVARLEEVGCTVTGTDPLTVTPPSWRPDLDLPAALVEEVLRLEGYDTIPSVLPAAPAGRGLTAAQQRKRAVSKAVAESGYVEVEPFPFVSDAAWTALGLPENDIRRTTVTVANPLDAERNRLTTTLLPGLLDTLVRNKARGFDDLALYTVGQVVLPHRNPVPMPDPAVDRRPTDAEIAMIDASLPAQPVHVGAVLAGNREPAGHWGKGRPVSWEDAVEVGRLVGRVAGVELRVTQAGLAPWHPGRCAALRVGEWVVGHAGELHPKVVEALGLPPRTCAMEIDLDAIPVQDGRPAPQVSPYPPISVDVALVTALDVPAADVEKALTEGGGELLEAVRLFDVYAGDQVGEGKRSLAYSLRFRASDRTLTNEEANESRDAAIAQAADRLGAAQR